MKTPLTSTLRLSTLFFGAAFAMAQGPLTPPGAPAPTQKSLQEIWDKIGTLEGTVTAQQQQLAVQQQRLAQQGALIDMLATAQGATLPWQLTTVDSTGDVGWYTSLAFTPGGQPAISYFNSGSSDLKYAVFNGSTWTLTTVDSAGSVGLYTSLAFTPGGQPAISYYDATNGELRFAVRKFVTTP